MSDGWWLIVVLLVLGVVWLAGGGPAAGQPSPVVLSPLAGRVADRPSSAADYRSGFGAGGTAQVKLSRGTASSADRPGDEYLVLSAPSGNEAPVVITGWTLADDQDQKTVLHQGKFYAAPVRRAIIPGGTLFFNPGGQHLKAPIVLNPGDRAYLISGSGKSFGDFPVTTSFKLNKCAGWLEEENDYELTPRLGARCPDPEDEFDTAGLPDECYDFLSRLPRCHLPEITNRRDEPRLVDGREGVPRACTDLAAERLGYAACFARHSGDPDFLGEEWYVYLGARFELWDADRETITLYDAAGKLVDQISY